jgi:hypothetical protein
MTTLEEEKLPETPHSLIDDTIQYIKTHKLEIILLLLGILFILYPQAVPGKYIQRGGVGEGKARVPRVPISQNMEHDGHDGAPPPANNIVIDKVKYGLDRIGSAIMRAFSVIASIFLVFGLISLPFIIYAIIFYFVVKRGFAAASTL